MRLMMQFLLAGRSPSRIPPARPVQPASRLGPSPCVETVAGGFPALCGGFQNMPSSAPGRRKIGARNVTLPFILASISADGSRQQPMLDRTGLTGAFDLTIEWLLQPLQTTDANAPQESSGALVRGLVLDRVEHPSENQPAVRA